MCVKFYCRSVDFCGCGAFALCVQQTRIIWCIRREFRKYADSSLRGERVLCSESRSAAPVLAAIKLFSYIFY